MPKLPFRADQFIIFTLVTAFLLFNSPSSAESTAPTVNRQTQTPLPTQTVTLPIIRNKQAQQPLLTAHASIVIDENTSSMLFQKNIDQKLPIASLTKLMTALVVLENYNLNDIITVSNEHTVDGNKIKLMPGEQLTVAQLLEGLLIFSGNDAAYALANHHPNGYDGFIATMNQKAYTLNLYQTSFSNPAGFDDVNQFSTANDMSKLMLEVVRKPLLLKIMGTEVTTIESIDQRFTHTLYNTNQLLAKMTGLVGGKTGSTPLAGECLATVVEKDGRKIITVLLGSQSRFAETTIIVDWVYDNYEWTTFTDIEYN